MSEFRFLCPQCGHAFLEGTSFTHCPKCRVPLLEAPHDQTADLRNLPDHIDLAALMKEVSAERHPDEDIDLAVQRIVARDYPEAGGGLCRIISVRLDRWEEHFGVSRNEAAEQLAASQSELVMRPDKKYEVRTTMTNTHGAGFDEIPADQREQLKALLDKAIDEGKSNQKIVITLPATKSKTSWGTIAAAVVILSLIAWRVWIALH
jgi:hypothetical protein